MLRRRQGLEIDATKPLPSPLEEAFCRAFVQLGGRLQQAALQAGLTHHPQRAAEIASRLFKRRHIRARISQLVHEALDAAGFTREKATQTLLMWILESDPRDRVRAMELVAKMAGWMPEQHHVLHQHVSIPAVGGQYEALRQTLEHYGHMLAPEQLQQIRHRLLADREVIGSILSTLDRLEKVVDAEPVRERSLGGGQPAGETEGGGMAG